MHIKHQKTEEVGRCLASLWLKQTVNNVFFRLFRSCVLRGCAGSGREAITAGPRSRAAAQKHGGGDASELMYVYLSSTPAGELSRSEASASVWACRFSRSSILFPSGVSPRPSRSIEEGKRMENQEVGGLSNMTKVVCF